MILLLQYITVYYSKIIIIIYNNNEWLTTTVLSSPTRNHRTKHQTLSNQQCYAKEQSEFSCFTLCFANNHRHRIVLVCKTRLLGTNTDFIQPMTGHRYQYPTKRTHFFAAGTLIPIAIGSMYAIYGNIYHQYTPNVSIYTIHGSYGIAKSITNTTARLFPRSAKNAQSACVSHRNQMILNGNRWPVRPMRAEMAVMDGIGKGLWLNPLYFIYIYVLYVYIYIY